MAKLSFGEYYVLFECVYQKYQKASRKLQNIFIHI